MGLLDSGFDSEVFRKDYPIIMATNRNTAVLLPVRLRYDSGGYVAGQVLARNTTDGLFQDYASGGSSGTDTAACVLYESHPVEDFDSTASTGSTLGVGIFGGCTLYEAKLIDLDSDAKTDLGARSIIDASGVTLLSF